MSFKNRRIFHNLLFLQRGCHEFNSLYLMSSQTLISPRLSHPNYLRRPDIFLNTSLQVSSHQSYNFGSYQPHLSAIDTLLSNHCVLYRTMHSSKMKKKAYILVSVLSFLSMKYSDQKESSLI